MQIHKFIFGTNTKMYMGIADTINYVRHLNMEMTYENLTGIKVFVLPSFPAIEPAAKEVAGSGLLIGSQNIGWESEGAFTGEVSPLMLREAGASIVMIGHSERRHILGETDELVNKKVRCAFAHGFTVLLCIGETREEKEAGIADEILSVQIKRDLNGVKLDCLEKLWVAYEPVWAIGAGGEAAGVEYVCERHRGIRAALNKVFVCETTGKIPLLYGGSVSQQNAEELALLPEVDGLFVGRAAWHAESFGEIIKRVISRLVTSGNI